VTDLIADTTDSLDEKMPSLPEHGATYQATVRHAIDTQPQNLGINTGQDDKALAGTIQAINSQFDDFLNGCGAILPGKDHRGDHDCIGVAHYYILPVLKSLETSLSALSDRIASKHTTLPAEVAK
jgi:hypothetical protein